VRHEIKIEELDADLKEINTQIDDARQDKKRLNWPKTNACHRISPSAAGIIV